MRKFLLATTAAALVFSLSGGALADHNRTASPSNTLAPPRATTPNGLVFSKNTDEATPIEQFEQSAPAVQPIPVDPQSEPAQAAPGDQAAPDNQAGPEQQASPDQQTAPDQQAVTPLDQMKPAIMGEDAAVADQLRDLVQNKLAQFVPKEHDRVGVLAFYQNRNFAPLWIAGGKAAPRAQQAMNFLHGVAADGLDPVDYPTPSFGNTDPAKLAADELTLTNSVVTFARHASIGRTAFSRVSASVWFDQKPPNPADVLGKLADNSDIGQALDSFNPQAPGYKALKAELAALRSGKDIEPKAAPKKEAHEPKKKSKRSKHQDEAAAKPHNTGKSAKIDTILANMERWRWLPHDLGAAYVMVNIPDFTLRVVQNGKTVWQTKIVDGKPGTHATPLLAQTMKYITINPTWNVPPSIIRNEYLPALAQDPNALARVGLKVGHNPDGSIRIYQPPGDRNALGRIRFNFPNKFLVYQHDTPDKYLFAKSERAYSHGCMRVQNPDQYAEVLLKISQPQDNYTAAKIRSMYGSSERTINLKHHIPVYITYQTAFVDDAGKPQVRADIYGLDKEVNAVLHGDRRVADVPVPRNYSSSSKPVMASGGHSRESRESRESSEPVTTGWNSSPGYVQENWRSAYQPPNRNRIW